MLRLHLADAGQRPAAVAILAKVTGDGLMPEGDDTELALKVPDAARAAEVLAALSQARVALAEFSLGAPSLDDVFFALTGHAAEAKREDENKEALA